MLCLTPVKGVAEEEDGIGRASRRVQLGEGTGQADR